MIGDVPKGAPLRCKFGWHTGQRDGGTMVFTCPRCGGSYWQQRDYSAVTAAADRLIDQGRYDEAQAIAREAVARGLSTTPPTVPQQKSRERTVRSQDDSA